MAEEPRGIRLVELRLAGGSAARRSYGVPFRGEGARPWRPLSVIAGQSQTGKTSVIDFVRYCLGDDEHPQHPEVISRVRESLLESVLAGSPTTIARSATGRASSFASVWNAGLDGLGDAEENRLLIEPTSDPEGLSQFVLAACGLDNVELPESPAQAESRTQMLSIRDLFRIMWLPNERLDNKNLAHEHSHHMVRQKFRQTIDVMFDVHDAAGTDLAARVKLANDAAREAERAASALRVMVQEEHPLGPLVLETEHEHAERDVIALDEQLAQIDRENASRDTGIARLRDTLVAAQREAQNSAVRVRNRQSLIDRLTALRSQYADDKKKLTFLKEAEQLFDPLNVVVCPACLSALERGPGIIEGNCSLCGHHVPVQVSELTLGAAVHTIESNGQAPPDHDVAGPRLRENTTNVLDAELKATTRRLAELNDYWTRLDGDLDALKSAQQAADRAVNDAASALDRLVEVPAPYLAARDDLARRRAEALLREQQSAAGLRLWRRVTQAEETADRLRGQVARLRAEQRAAARRPDRANVISRLSLRFGEILQDIGYPKLGDPRIDDQLIPYVRGLPYNKASSGGLVLISIAWYLSIWETAYERAARAPGLLIIDSPQKSLGHDASPDDNDFADAQLVENFYRHAKAWLGDAGAGAQLVVIDNSPPDIVAGDVVVRYTRNRSVPPYGLIEDAID